MAPRLSILAVGLMAAFAPTSRAGESRPVRALIVDGRNNHAWEGTTHALKQILQQTGGFTVDVSSAPAPFSKPAPQRPAKGTDEEVRAWEAEHKKWQAEEKTYEKSIEAQWDSWRPRFADYDVVIDNYNGPEWRPGFKDDLARFVRDGGGLVLVHAANNAFSGWDDFNRMIGIGWRKHDQGVRLTVDDATGRVVRQPSGEGPDSGHGSKHPFAIRTRKANHPIVRGMPAGWMHGTDELYHAMRGPAEGVTILATAFSDEKQRGTGQHEPVLWTTEFGRGRVVTTSLGHYWVGGAGEGMRDALHCVGFQAVFARSCQWAASGEVTLDVPKEFPTSDRTSIVHPEDLEWRAGGKTLPLAPQAISDARERARRKKAINPFCLLSPEESMATMEMPSGYRLELVVGEPHIREPVLCTWDGNGTLYVAEMRSYMQDEYGTGTKTMRNGRISRHEDTDGDGIPDRHTVFVDGLNLPRMMLPLDDRLAVVETDTMDVVVYRDGDGDGVAEEKTLAYKGRRKIEPDRSVEHQDSGLVWALDNWIYLSRGIERYRFTRGKWDVDSIEFDWNQWGLGQDDTGRLFFNENSVPAKSFQQHPVYWKQISSRAKGRSRQPSLGAGYDPSFLTIHSICEYGDRGEKHSYQAFTSATGGSLFRGDALPREFEGNYFICEPTGHIVRRAKVDREAGKITLANAYDAEKREFLASTDINFRPVSTHTAPDGCLYIVDMYRGMIQDAPWVNDGMKSFLRRTGLNFNIHHGRVYRVVHDGQRPKQPPRLLDLPTSQLVEHLASDNGWIRDTAQKLIVLRKDRGSATPRLLAMAASHENPLARVHALWTLEGCDAIGGEILARGFKDADWRVREAAIRIAEPMLKAGDERVWREVAPLATDDDPNVARQLILSLGFCDNERAIALIDTAIAKHLTNEVVYLSAMTALFDRETPMIRKIRDGSAFRAIKDPTLRIGTQRRWTQGLANWKQESAPMRPLDDEAVNLVKDGYQIYAQLCVNCHGEDGRGSQLPGQPAKAPRLAGSPRVLGPKEVLARIVLHGLTGPVDGVEYREVMAPNDKNDDRWIASAMSYIRQDWGNLASVIRPDDVARTRIASKGRYRPWTLKELEQYALPELTDRSSWKLNSSSGPEAAARALNGKNHPWEIPNQPGGWFQVDLGSPHTVTSLVLTSSGEDRYPRSYEVFVSGDGSRWGRPVAVGKGEGSTTTISLEPAVGRFLKVVQTANDPLHRWAISDLKVHGVAGEARPTLAGNPADEGPLPPIEVLEKLPGDASKGQAVFAKTCTTCHQVNGQGTNLGPDLSKVGDRLKKVEILQSILEPSAVIDEKFRGQVVVTDEGQILSGFVTEEPGESLTIRTADNVIHKVRKDRIDGRQPMKSSFMPDGLERTMSKAEFLDLVAFLSACK